MTDVTTGQGRDGVELSAADEQLVRELTERARTGGLKLAGEGGLLGRLAKMVIEGVLEGELDDHLGYARHAPEGRDGAGWPDCGSPGLRAGTGIAGGTTAGASPGCPGKGSRGGYRASFGR